jgi:hypothetical protein
VRGHRTKSRHRAAIVRQCAFECASDSAWLDSTPDRMQAM